MISLLAILAKTQRSPGSQGEIVLVVDRIGDTGRLLSFCCQLLVPSQLDIMKHWVALVLGKGTTVVVTVGDALHLIVIYTVVCIDGDDGVLAKAGSILLGDNKTILPPSAISTH